MADTAPTPATGDLHSAASAIEGLLAGDDTPDTQADDRQEEAAQAPDDGAENADSQEAQPDEEAPPEEGDAEEEGQAQPTAPDDLLYTVTIDGKPEQVSVKELSQGYLRQRDYTQKTQALAEEKRAFEPHRAQVNQERQQYAQLLPLVVQFLQSQHPPEPPLQLLDQDPIEYQRQRAHFDNHQRRLQASLAEQQRMAALNAQSQSEAMQKIVADGREKLFEAVPDWKDAKKWEADRVAIAKYAVANGYSEEEVSQATDPRAIIAMRKAMLYDELMARKPQAAPVNRGAPKPLAAGAAQQGPSQGLRTARQRLQQSGKVEDAAKWFERSGLV